MTPTPMPSGCACVSGKWTGRDCGVQLIGLSCVTPTITATPSCRTENQSCANVTCCNSQGLFCNSARICVKPVTPTTTPSCVGPHGSCAPQGCCAGLNCFLGTCMSEIGPINPSITPIPRICNPGATKCRDTNSVEICNSNGTAWSLLRSCAYGCSGSGVCNAAPKTCSFGGVTYAIGKAICQGNQPAECLSTGAWKLFASCAYGCSGSGVCNAAPIGPVIPVVTNPPGDDNKCPDVQACPNTIENDLLQNCTPADADGTSKDYLCNADMVGKRGPCGGKEYCCPSAGGAWTTDMTNCQTTTCKAKTDPYTLNDYSIWRSEYIEGDFGSANRNTWNADFDCDGKVTLNDFSIWRTKFINGLSIK